MAMNAIDQITERERAFAARYPRLYAALMGLGETNAARAQVLDISLRQFHNIKQGVASLRASQLEVHPELAQAWYADMSALSSRAA